MQQNDCMAPREVKKQVGGWFTERRNRNWKGKSANMATDQSESGSGGDGGGGLFSLLINTLL